MFLGEPRHWKVLEGKKLDKNWGVAGGFGKCGWLGRLENPAYKTSFFWSDRAIRLYGFRWLVPWERKD